MNELFVIGLGAVLLTYLFWGFRVLPAERWQILAALPRRQSASGEWQGLNLTWYGLLSSVAQLVSVMMLFLLLGAINITRTQTVLLVVVILGLCVPASRLIAHAVEKKSATFSIGGAAFVGILLAPWAVLAGNALLARWFDAAPLVPALAAMGIAYALGEGLGRLACISFGCCYGKALHQSPPLARRLFARWHFVFHGETKKIAYAGRMAGEKVIPVQALTALLYTLSGLTGVLLFLNGWYATAMLLTLAVTQLWRVFSETWRADWRGNGRLSAYQWFALLSVAYVTLLVAMLPPGVPPAASLVSGLETLWHPGLLLCLIAFWVAVFIYYGRSLVTGSRLSLYLCHDRV